MDTLLTLSATDLKASPEYSMAVQLDWQKVARYLLGEWPTPWPAYITLGYDAYRDEVWLNEALQAPYVVFDVETEKLEDGGYSGRIIQVGLYPAGGIPAIWDASRFPDFPFTDCFSRIASTCTTVAHNAPFDVARIRDNFGINVSQYRDLDDTILMWATLWAELPKGLAFVTSIHSEHPKAKHLGVGNYDYLVGDIVGTAEAYDAMQLDFKKDPASLNVYNIQKRLLPIIILTAEQGFPVNENFVLECLDWIPQQLDEALSIAQAYAGFPLSLESGYALRGILDEGEDIFKAASKAAGFATTKKYSEKGGNLSFDKETVDGLRGSFVPLEFNEEATVERALERIAQGGHPLLEAKALWGKARVLLSNYIKPLLLPLEERGELYFAQSLHVGEGAPELLFKEI